MSSFLEKVRKCYSKIPNEINFMLIERLITRSEHTLLIFIFMFDFAKKHKTSITQLSKMTSMDRENVSACLKSLAEKNIIEIQQVDKYIIVHHNITIEFNCSIRIENRDDATRRDQELIDSEIIEQDDDIQDLPENPQVNPNYLPENPQVTCRKTGTIEQRYKIKIENKDITREFALAGGMEVATTEKQEKEYRKEVKTAYIDAYEKRYKVRPFIDNPKSHSLIKNLVKQVGHDTAIKLCYEYLKSNDSYAVKERHPLSLLIQNPTKFIVDNKIGRVNSVDQRMLDLKEANERSYKQWLESKGEKDE